MLSSQPFMGPVVVTQNFGANHRLFSRLRFAGLPLRGHNGMDFQLPVGTPVLAVQGGVVLAVANQPDGYGHYVVVGHSWGQTLYSQLSRVDVRKAQQIEAAKQLGLSGKSGGVYAPHLHFGMRIFPFSVRDGWCGFSDPTPYLARLGSPLGPIIGPHLIGGVPKQLDLLAKWRPRMALILDPNPDEVRALRAVCPETTIVGRIYFDPSELTRRIVDDPAEAAGWVHEKTLRYLPSDVDYWQVANEILQDKVGLPLLAHFEQCRMTFADIAGYKCAILGFSVGNPDLPEDDRMAHWRLVYPALEQAELSHHCIALHQYGMPDLWGPDQQFDWYIHRLEHQVLRLLPYKKVKFAVTEFGIDGLIQGNAPSGWRTFTDPVSYVGQLLGAGSYLEQFSGRILGYAVFTLGHNAPWATYEISGEAASLLAAHSERGTWDKLTTPVMDIFPGQTDTTAKPGPHTHVKDQNESPNGEDGDMNPNDDLVDRRLSRAFAAHNMQIRAISDRPEVPPGDTVYLIKDLFTTVNGSWDASDHPAGVPDWARQEYLRAEFLEAGANHHLFGAVLDINGQLQKSFPIHYWSDGFEQIGNPHYDGYVVESTKESSGWANLFIGAGSSFAPDQGEQGPWCWMPGGASEVICGGGLPLGHTISTFVVWQAVSRQSWEDSLDPPTNKPAPSEPDDNEPGPDDEQDPNNPGDEEPDSEPDTEPDTDDGKSQPPVPNVVRRISPWVASYNLTVKHLDERPDQVDGDILFIVKDVFTTRQGSWELSDQPGAVPEWARIDYLKELGAPDYFDDAGSDHHLFAAVLGQNGQFIRRQPILYWSDGFDKLGDETFRDYVWRITKERSGWANIPIGPGSSYVPEREESGPWCWAPVGAAEVMCGGGLPANHHISVFVVWQAVKSTQAGGDDPDSSPNEDEDDSTFLPIVGSDGKSVV